MKLCGKSVKISSLGLVLLIGFLRFVRSEDESTEENNGIPIIRQINKVNDDGTYTYGYEAADGSFKIETRDVLGNVKGMFGFIDESGELKRVSYTANNETGFRNSIIHPSTSTPSGYSTARPQPPEPLGRRPVLILKNMPILHSPTKGPVIQHIPKKLKDEEDENVSSTTSSDYVGVNGRRFPTISNSSKNTSEEHSEDVPKLNPLRKVLVSKRPVEDKEIKGKGGNSLRRQLNRGLDLRGEMAHIYSGGDSRYSPNLPPHLSALMSELRPIQVVRSSPETIGYQTVDIEAVPQDINEVPTTTTELPYGTRKYVQPSAPPGYISPRYRPRPVSVPVPEETQYLQEVQPHYKHSNVPVGQGLPNVPQHLPLALNVPFGAQGSPNYQMQPQYYETAPYMLPTNLRDELMAIIYNYLQLRLNPLTQNLAQNPYYQNIYSRIPYGNPYISPLINPYANPNNPYPNPNNPYPNPNYPYPYPNPYLGAPQYYPYPNPNTYPIPSQTPYASPNVQFSPRQEPPRRIASRLPTRSATDDADLLQMLLTSPTRVPISQFKYSPTTERVLSSKSTQPIRNIQIITDTTESRPVTTETPER